MQITNLRTERHDDRVRVAAHVQWEEAKRPSRDIFYETEAPFADRLRCDANAFVAAAVVPAMRYGEKRMMVAGAICPKLHEGVRTATALLRRWYGPPRSDIRIEPSEGFTAARPPAEPRAACFISGGVDSLGMIRANRLNYPLDHPLSFRDAYFVYGIDMAVNDDTGARMKEFAWFRRTMQPIVEDAQLDMIPVFTNFKQLEPDIGFWFAEFLGPGVASIGLAMGARSTDLSIGSSDYIGHLKKAGSHPLLDPNFSTAGLRVCYEQVGYRRLDKVRLIADWPAARHNLRVCYDYEDLEEGMMNCGRCPKCVYTQLELLVCGKLAEAPTFRNNDMTPADVDVMRIASPFTADTLTELLDPLERMGRADLVRVIRRKVRRYHAWPARLKRGTVRWLKQIDAEHLGGRLRRARNRR